MNPVISADDPVVLEALASALRRETHHLARHPALLWQQLHNRLCWEDEPVRAIVERERASRSARPVPASWLRLRRRLPETEALVRTLEHPAGVSTCCVGPSGQFIVSAATDGTLKLWDAATGVERRTLTGHQDAVVACAVSPDGRFIVSASRDHTLKIWDVASLAEPRCLGDHRSVVTACAVSPDCSFVLSASVDSTLKVWDPMTGELLKTLDGHRGPVWACAISPDGSFVISGGDDGTVGIWNVGEWDERARLKGHTALVSACAISPDAELVVSASSDTTLKVWVASTGAEQATLRGHSAEVRACAFSPDRSFVVSAGGDRTLKVWDPLSGDERHTLGGHERVVQACAITPDGKLVVSASSDTTLRVWDAAPTEDSLVVSAAGDKTLWKDYPASALLRSRSAPTELSFEVTGIERQTLRGHSRAVQACEVTPDGAYVVSASRDGTVKVWDLAAGAEQWDLGKHGSWVSACAVSPDGSFVASASKDGTVKIWDAGTGENRTTLRGHDGLVWSCAASPDGSVIVSAGSDGTLRLWGPAGQGPAVVATHGTYLLACAVSPDGSFVVSADGEGTLKIWDAVTGRELATMSGHAGPVRSCVVSPDALFVVSASNDATLKIWNAATWQERVTLTGHTGPVEACAVSPDCSFVVSGSRDGTLRIWDTATGNPRPMSGSHAGWVSACAISPDAWFVVSAGTDGTLKLWDAATGEELGTLRGHAAPVTACAVSPDSSFVVSGGDDATVRVWDRAAKKEVACLPLLGSVACLSLHGSEPFAAVGDVAGNVYFVTLVVDYRSVVATGVSLDVGAYVRCPSCLRYLSLDESPLGQEFSTPHAGCTARVRPNPFLVERRPSIRERLELTGLPEPAGPEEVLTLSFAGTRSERVVVQGFQADGMATLLTALPEPERGREEVVLRNLLRTTFEANYVKAISLEPSAAFLAQLPQELASAPTVEGLIRGLAQLGDVSREELGLGTAMEERMRACSAAQGALISVNIGEARAELLGLAERAGLSVQQTELGGLGMQLVLGGLRLPVVMHAGPEVVSMMAFLGHLRPKKDIAAYYRGVLELNKSARVAKVGLRADDGFVLAYEVPVVRPDLFEHVWPEFQLLIGGMLELERSSPQPRSWRRRP